MELTENLPSLEELTRQIVFHAQQSDDHIITAATLFRDAKSRVEAGEAGDVKWEAWARKNIGLCDARLRDLRQIADAEDPAAELERQRAMNRKRVAKHREKKASEAWKSDADKLGLIEWTKKAPSHHVQVLFKQAQRVWAGR